MKCFNQVIFKTKRYHLTKSTPVAVWAPCSEWIGKLLTNKNRNHKYQFQWPCISTNEIIPEKVAWGGWEPGSKTQIWETLFGAFLRNRLQNGSKIEKSAPKCGNKAPRFPHLSLVWLLQFFILSYYRYSG